MSLRLTPSAGLRPTATAHLAQTMSLLALSNAELEEKVRAELDNPALEVVDEHRCRTCGRPIPRRGHCPLCADRGLSDAPIVYLTPRDWELGAGAAEPDLPDPGIAAPEKLAEHLLRQIGPELTLEERPLAAHIVFSLDEDGLLAEPAAEIALRLRVSLDQVRRILTLLQNADPPGVGAANVQESLLIQLRVLDEENEAHDPGARPLLALAEAIVAGHFKLLGRHEYAHLARLLSASRAEVEAAALFIRRNLTPYPARAFWGSGKGSGASGGAASGRYYCPDVSIHRHPTRPDGPLVVEITTPTAGWLRVNPAFKQALRACPEGERSEWEQYYERALLYTKCLQQRNNTMRRLMESIVAAQKEFILCGDRYLEPMTRAALARQLEVHEYTISRAVSAKTAALPGGRIIPLSRFFDRSLPVREVIKDLIAGEPACAPLTDEAIVGRLEMRGIQVARRTVAKYRTAEGILPAAMRGRLHNHTPCALARHDA
ncbi:MAG: hypothetical protein HY784_15380 [Chloroflexi bacterium]|nr:hypothetical protein [Chloroflexota bacterium]